MSTFEKIFVTIIVICFILLGLVALPILVGLAGVLLPILGVIGLIVAVPIIIGIIIGGIGKK